MNTSTGAAYMYEGNNSWQQEAEFAPLSQQTGAQFGASVSIGSGQTTFTASDVLIGAPFDNPVQQGTSGAAYTFSIPPYTFDLNDGYSCSSPLGYLALNGTVSGRASIKHGVINLKNVSYSITNSVGLDLGIDHVTMYTPDPDEEAAPYLKNSVRVTQKPRGWRAGHDVDGVFATHPQSMTVAAGRDIVSAALSAKYRVTGPPGAEILFMPGSFTFHLNSPVEGDAVCTVDAGGGGFTGVIE